MQEREPSLIPEVAVEQFKPEPLTALFDIRHQNLTQTQLKLKCEEVLQQMDSLYTVEQLLKLEEVTREQRKAASWQEHRQGRITASVMHRILKMRPSTDPMNVVFEIMGYKKTQCTAAMRWGIENEEAARLVYEEVQSKGHVNFICRKSGLVVSNAYPFLGASPDAHTECKCCGEGIVEIKCPYKHRNQGILDCVSDLSFCLDDDYQLKHTHMYFTQIQGQLMVSDARHCDLFIWLKSSHFVTRVRRDETFIKNLAEKCVQFFGNHVIAEILTRKSEAVNTLLCYCFCQRPAYGRMLFCNGESCEIGWFHHCCAGVGVNSPSLRSWLCPQCAAKITQPPACKM